jgi:hypothetical protein
MVTVLAAIILVSAGTATVASASAQTAVEYALMSFRTGDGIAPLVHSGAVSRIHEACVRSVRWIVRANRSGNHAAPRRSRKESIMPRRMSIALAVTVLALAAASTVNTAAAFPYFFWPAVPGYLIPL